MRQRVLWFSALATLTFVERSEAGPGGKIAFASLREGNGDIYVMDVDGWDLMNLVKYSRLLKPQV